MGTTGFSGGIHLDFEYGQMNSRGEVEYSDPGKYLSQIAGQAVSGGSLSAPGAGQGSGNGSRQGPGQGSGLLAGANSILTNLGLPGLTSLPQGFEVMDDMMNGMGGGDMSTMLSTLMGSIGQLWASGKSAASQVVSSFTHNFNMTITLVPQNADGSKGTPTTVTANPVVTVGTDQYKTDSEIAMVANSPR
jgi:hypothetical protein